MRYKETWHDNSRNDICKIRTIICKIISFQVAARATAKVKTPWNHASMKTDSRLMNNVAPQMAKRPIASRMNVTIV
jgi:hypothetical protein